MGEVKERAIRESEAKKDVCDICKEKTEKVFFCEVCSAEVCRDCFVPYEIDTGDGTYDFSEEDGRCIFCHDNE